MSGGSNSAPATGQERDPAQTAPAGDPGVKPRGARRIVVAGECNSGKTSLVNTLLGAPVLSASFVTHTVYPTVVAFAARPGISAEVAGRKRVRLAWDRMGEDPPEETRWLRVGLPLEPLRGLRVIDTPGLDGADEERDQRTLRICRQADTLIWCTPAMQAWKASEERAWLALPERVRRRGTLAVTFADTIAAPADKDRVLARLRDLAGCYFGSVVMASELKGLAAPSGQTAISPGSDC